ncbi:MAG TPA: HAD-IA family hydrolase [Anaerolineae bacterium]|nr:HAD-IA family hydrolase [Anaerolineae bacterium]
MERPNSESRYDMVIFDVGGTLAGFHEQGPFRDFLKEVGLPASDEDARRLHHKLISVIIARRDAAQGQGAVQAELDEWWRGNFATTWPDRPDLVEEMFDWLLEGRFDRLFSDVLPTLEALQGMDIPMAVLSNFGTHLHDILRRFDLLDYFQFVVISAEVGLAKPDPRIFDLVVEHSNRPRQRLLYVGDHVGDDIAGARGAGLDAVLIDRRDHQPDALCPRIGSLLELVEYVRHPVRPARSIILDMDGVVLASPPLHLLTWQRTLAPLGIELKGEDLFPLEGMPTELTAQRLTQQFLGQACSQAEARALAATKRTLFREMFNLTFVPGIVPLLHDLRGRGFRLGLVTGSARGVVEESLAPTGVTELFEAIITGDEVSQGKPDPEPYLTAAAHLGIPPEACLVIENAPLGIRSARAAGMSCVGLETTLPARRLTEAGAGRVFHDARTLRTWLLYEQHS